MNLIRLFLLGLLSGLGAKPLKKSLRKDLAAGEKDRKLVPASLVKPAHGPESYEARAEMGDPGADSSRHPADLAGRYWP